MSKKLFLPKPKRLGAEWSYLLQDDDGYWEAFHKVNGKIKQCGSNCPYCGKYGKMERCRIKTTLIGTDTTRTLTLAGKETITALKNILNKRGSLRGIVVTLRGKGGDNYELVDIKEPAPKKQLALWGES